MPSIEGFNTKFQDMKSLHWPARHLNRFLLQSLTREQWQEAAKYLRAKIASAVIVGATA